LARINLTKEEIISNKISTPKSQGVYFLIHKEEIVYIGSSIHMDKRIRDHKIANKINFDSYFTYECKDLLLEEIKYILIFRPKYNINIDFELLPKIGYIANTTIKSTLKSFANQSQKIQTTKILNKDKPTTVYVFSDHQIYLLSDVLEILNKALPRNEKGRKLFYYINM